MLIAFLVESVHPVDRASVSVDHAGDTLAGLTVDGHTVFNRPEGRHARVDILHLQPVVRRHEEQIYILLTSRENLLDTIQAAARGETLLKPEILARVLSARPAAPSPTSDSTLTERELEVLQAAARGERNKEIAYKLGITERTVKAHLASIYHKFSVDSRAAAVAIAAQKGLLAE